MLAAYGVDVLDPEVSTRRVHMLLERLPPQFRLPGEHWSTEAELLAVLCDQVAMLTWVTMRANGAKVGKPKPIRRPPHRLRPAPASPSATRNEGQPGKASGWFEAARMLAGMPGVVSDVKLRLRVAGRSGQR